MPETDEGKDSGRETRVLQSAQPLLAKVAEFDMVQEMLCVTVEEAPVHGGRIREDRFAGIPTVRDLKFE